jgi:hypothetical protein
VISILGYGTANIEGQQLIIGKRKNSLQDYYFHVIGVGREAFVHPCRNVDHIQGRVCKYRTGIEKSEFCKFHAE